MWKCEGQNREYMTVTAHCAVENGEQKCFEMKNALLEDALKPDVQCAVTANKLLQKQSKSFVKNKAALAIFLRQFCEFSLPLLPASLGTRSNFWNILEGLVKVLTPFEDATIQVSKDEATLSECIPYAHTLLRSLENLHHPTDDEPPVTGLESFITVLKERIKP
ncbi:---NA--- [Paramuricea clavata]|uniref:---NA n=1 Tax=Paramuricea clavata TaxID=317549 RepID=A0A7D9DNP5_PARCT|nr:---NA--- [Paramuricea clavata]